jgi:hypothetical protein
MFLLQNFYKTTSLSNKCLQYQVLHFLFYLFTQKERYGFLLMHIINTAHPERDMWPKWSLTPGCKTTTVMILKLSQTLATPL